MFSSTHQAARSLYCSNATATRDFWLWVFDSSCQYVYVKPALEFMLDDSRKYLTLTILELHGILWNQSVT